MSVELEAIRARCEYDHCEHCTNQESRKFYVHPCPSCIYGNKDWFELADGHEPPPGDIPALLAYVEELEKELARAIADIPHRCWKCGYAHCNSGNDCDMAHYIGSSDDCKSWYWRGQVGNHD